MTLTPLSFRVQYWLLDVGDEVRSGFDPNYHAGACLERILPWEGSSSAPESGRS